MSQDIIKCSELYEQILNRLYITNLMSSSALISILRDLCSLCNRTKYIKKIYHSFEHLGINILPDVMLHKLRLKGVTLIIKAKKTTRCIPMDDIIAELPYVKSIAISYPKKIVATLYIPEDANVDSIIGINRDNLEVNIYETSYTIRSKPLPKYLFMLLEGAETVFSDKSFYECLENPMLLPEGWSKRPKITGLILHVLDVLSVEPMLTVDEVRMRISTRLHKEVSWSKIKRYIKNASKFIYGYRVSITKAPNVSSVKLGLAVEGLRDPTKFCTSIIRHPLTLACSWSDTNKALVYFSLPEMGLDKFIENLYWFVDQFGGEVTNEFRYIISKGLTSAVSLPYTEWSSLLKSWIKYENVLAMIIGRLKEVNCIEI